MSTLIVFDLDGVVTSEEAYWDAAGLTLHELLYSPRYWDIDGYRTGQVRERTYQPVTSAEESRRVGRATFPEADILAFKARAINSNWDTCYAAVCLRLIDLLARLPDYATLLPLRPWDAGWMAAFRDQARREGKREERGRAERDASDMLRAALALPVFQGAVGLGLINRCDAYATDVLGRPIEGVFSRYSPFWDFCRDIFQEWYLGDDLYRRTYQRPPAQPGKPGCIHFERPLLPVERIRETLEALSREGYTLGLATGRVRQEALVPLKKYGLLSYFDERHISTYDAVERAEAELRARGEQALLSKPHPFPFLFAVDQRSQLTQGQNRPAYRDFIVVGDSTSDILGGKAAGALTIAVLTGARTPEVRTRLAESESDWTIDDMTQLPALLERLDSLMTIQRLQFSEREKGERLLQLWFARHMNLRTESVTLASKAVSLNSFNGFYRVDGEEYFFKTHVEEQGILAEYYHAELLHSAGYNIVRPLRTLHEEGRQMVVYPVVYCPVMFDLLRAVETNQSGDVDSDLLAAAEARECTRLLGIYRETLAASTAEEHARAPIHQLFWHRLVGGRLKSFYQGKEFSLPDGSGGILFEELLNYRWIINGAEQEKTLGQLIERAKLVLDPARAAMTSIGHGDAHFGNVFLENRRDYLYFDPAFAGRHMPLLDVIKPLFHNVFATWMYFPADVAQDLQLSISVRGATLSLRHNYALTPSRQAILQTKVTSLLTPLIEWLRACDALPSDWLEIVQLALLCCPLLTINLSDGERLPSSIGWLGLSQAVQVGNSGIQSWRNEL